jgi:hypothetical protein
VVAASGRAAVAADLDTAYDRVVALEQFVRDKRDNPKFKEYENADGTCLVDQSEQYVILTFSADGTLHCRIPAIAEGYRIRIYVLTTLEYAIGTDRYSVAVRPGQTPKVAVARVGGETVAAAIRREAQPAAAQQAAEWWHPRIEYGPYPASSIVIEITNESAGVDRETKLDIATLSTFSLAVFGLAGRGFDSYEVLDGKIGKDHSEFGFDYYFGAQVYPLSWNRNAFHKLRPGRYFSEPYESCVDRWSLVLGLSANHPFEAAYLGVGFEVVHGIAITAGWQPRRVEELKSGYAVGSPVVGDKAPIDKRWDAANFGIGIALDSTIARFAK